MIRKPNNWNEVQEFTDRPKLPLGAYVCKVRRAVIQSNDYGEQLCILFDIAEGEFAGFFDADFKANTRMDKKWKGVLRQFIPKDDGSEKDEWTKSSFKGMVTSFEKSNPGYQWNWDEASLSGKLVGILFRNEEWEYEGKTGWAVRPFRAISVDSVRSGDFTLPKDKPLKNKTASSVADNFNALNDRVNQTFAESEDDGELPF
jgi:hypothetical protein